MKTKFPLSLITIFIFFSSCGKSLQNAIKDGDISYESDQIFYMAPYLPDIISINLTGDTDPKFQNSVRDSRNHIHNTITEACIIPGCKPPCPKAKNCIPNINSRIIQSKHFEIDKITYELENGNLKTIPITKKKLRKNISVVEFPYSDETKIIHIGKNQFILQ